MADHDTHGGSRLRAHRVGRVMTQHDVAQRLERLAWLLHHRRVGVNPDMVSKWERGVKQPSSLYLKLLCTIFEATPADLGFDDQVRALHLVGDGTVRIGEHAPPLLEVLDERQAPVELLRAKIISLWRKELLSRRDLLKAMGIAPATVGLNGLGAPISYIADVEPPRFRDAETVTQLSELAAHLERAYHTADPQSLLMPVQALVETAEHYIDVAASHGARQELLRIVARGELLLGRISHFDLHHSLEARAHLGLAREAAEEASDPLLESAALGHMAFIPAEKHHFGAAVSYIEGARARLRRHDAPPIRSWLTAIDAELNTNAGQIAAALSSLEEARATLSSPRPEPVAEWFDFFDDRRLDGFEGFTLRRAGDAGAARVRLERAASPASGIGPKQRAVATIDLAVARVEDGDVDAGCRFATGAVSALQRTRYATAVDRLSEFQVALPDANHPAARLLMEAMAELS
jgi:transcriptional regulator with XRE-family HTH domain